jgi:hypothetical protein
VARNLAATPYVRVLLNFDERADLGLITDLAPIQVDEFAKLDVPAKLDARGYRDKLADGHTIVVIHESSSEGG